MGKVWISRAACLNHTPWHVIAVIPLSLAGAAQIFYATTLGVAAYSDSTEYIVSARNLISGHGLGLITPTGRLMPLYFHPPLYPLVLSALGAPGLDLLGVARWLNIVLFGLLIALVGKSAWSLTSSIIVTISVSLLVVTSSFLVSTFTAAQAEPLFLVLGIASLMLSVRAANQERRSLMIAAALLAGLTAATRYIGLAFLFPGAAFLVVRSRNDVRSGLRRAFVYLGIGLAPLVFWLGYLEIAQSGTNPRLFDPPENLWSELAPFRIAFTDVTWNWIGLPAEATALPYRTRLVAIPLVVVISATAVIARKRISNTNYTSGDRIDVIAQAALVVSLFSVAYVSLLAFTFSFYLPKLDLDTRTFSPYLLALTAGILLALFSLTSNERYRKLQTLLFASVVLVIAIRQLTGTATLTSDLHQKGRGFTGLRWQSSETLQAVFLLDPSIPLISNETAAIMLLMNRSPFELPELESKVPSPIIGAFGDGATRAERIFREEGAALVLFDSIQWQMLPLYGESTPERLDALVDGLFLLSDLADGSIHFYADPSGE
ncbi:MAG: hypothetical protein IH858_11790 [Chloroflexi bacterium]|nr:hypothetical protein [Chloroflexota bacterium]